MNNKILCRKLLLVGALISITLEMAYAENQIINGDFSDNDNAWRVPEWWTGGDGASEVDSLGRFCTTVSEVGTENWGAQLRQDSLKFINGATYNVKFQAWASAPLDISISGIDESGDFVWFFGDDLHISSDLESVGQSFNLSFTISDDSTDNGTFRFLLGAGAVPVNETVCFDNIVVDNEASDLEKTNIQVRVNQIGYLPEDVKNAAYILTDETNFSRPRTWSLMHQGNLVATGETSPHGETVDPASGDWVHSIDFSDYKQTGEGYSLVVTDGDNTYSSPTFAISDAIYHNVKYDALSYFYHNRSGTDIESDVVGESHARQAGHESDAAVDTLSCLRRADDCSTVDVSGGWYDAGDHGKYVVNGGITVWTLLNQYERTQYLGSSLADFSDGSMALPDTETVNTIPDLLDEVKWEIEWFLKMQVARDKPLAGMVHHKVHDLNWTGMPLAPYEDTETRYVHPVSTSATLNFAAVTAQCYRVYKSVDTELADKCLSQSEIAYTAALKNPNLYAAEESTGGGTYSDSLVTDEFYWAATELFISTGKEVYATAMKASDFHMTIPDGNISLLSWQRTNALGLISLATIGDPNNEWVRSAREILVTAADNYVETTHGEAYKLPIDSESYTWGSNSDVVNNMIVLGLAFDFTGEQQYINAMIQGANYLFGHNALSHSYVTGYGTSVEKYPHHRFWSNILDSGYPSAPAGVLAGGPNTGLEDPYAGSKLVGCSPQKCFVDDISAWSVNEVTINWNAPFAWVTAYLDDYAMASGNANNSEEPVYINAALTETTSVEDSISDNTLDIEQVSTQSLVQSDSLPLSDIKNSCEFAYKVMTNWNTGYIGEVVVSNKTEQTITSWLVDIVYANNDQVISAWNAELSTTGGQYQAANASWNGAIKPGESVSFGMEISKASEDTTIPSVSGVCV